MELLDVQGKVVLSTKKGYTKCGYVSATFHRTN